MLRFKVIT